MGPDDEAARYRKAADLALGQLDWCERYLNSIRKTRLARQISNNRESIRRRLDEAAGGDATVADPHEGS